MALESDVRGHRIPLSRVASVLFGSLRFSPVPFGPLSFQALQASQAFEVGESDDDLAKKDPADTTMSFHRDPSQDRTCFRRLKTPGGRQPIAED